MKFYYCKHCKNLELVIHDGGSVPVCCGETMTVLTANTTEAASEKHLPVIKKEQQKVVIRVGEIDHPMTPEHLIEWIAATDGKTIEIKHLTASDQPMMQSNFDSSAKLSVYAYCNLHGLWLTEGN